MASGSRSRSRGRGKSSKSGKAADTAPAVDTASARPTSMKDFRREKPTFTGQSLSLASRAHNLHSPRATELDGSSVDFDFGAGAWYALVFAAVLAAVACAVQSYYPHLQHASCEDSCKLGYPSLDSAAALWAYAQEWWALHGSPADMTLMAGAGAVAGMVYGGFVAEPLH